VTEHPGSERRFSAAWDVSIRLAGEAQISRFGACGCRVAGEQFPFVRRGGVPAHRAPIRSASPISMLAATLATGQGGFVSPGAGRTWSKESVMSVYRVTEIIGTSSTSWEDAAAEAIRTAAGTLRDLRVAEVVKQDIHLDESGAITYRTKLQLSFKYEPGN
jgi:dodecin